MTPAGFTVQAHLRTYVGSVVRVKRRFLAATGCSACFPSRWQVGADALF